ncbi:MAG: 6-phosphofructokinase [Deltaproteobacteria bacterium]|nr:6-phosphofructokinase [Deltaproteobacteria bacterium]
MNVGILTGGGDCPGLNAVIRAVVRRGLQFGYGFTGIKDGWKGLVETTTVKLTRDSVSGILPRGGTILGTSRTNPLKSEKDTETVVRNVKSLGLDALVCIGGDDTLGVAARLFTKGINTVGVPKTIDNDLSGTDFTFGFDTAVGIVACALDRLHTTTEAHHRVMVVEVMGRHAGWIAVYGGLAGGAHVILIPEKPFDIDEVCRCIENRKTGGRAFGHARLGGVGEFLANELEKRTGIESRHVVLGHLQRGGTPTAHDRILATRFGVRAIELVNEGRFGRMVALHGDKIADVSLSEATSKAKTVDMEFFKTAEVFFG